jgi:hypothetical protein
MVVGHRLQGGGVMPGHLVAALAATAAVGLGLGTALHAVTSPPPAPPPTATLHVSAVDAQLDLATAAPRLLLDVSLVTAQPGVHVVAATVTGAGVSGPATLAEPSPARARATTEEGGHLSRVGVWVPLSCSDADLADVSTPTLTLQLGLGAGAGTVAVTAAPGDWLLPSGLCQWAYESLPQGWQHPAVAASFTVDANEPRQAVVVVTGLPINDPVVTLAPFRFPVQTQAEARTDGTATITLLIDGCPATPQPALTGFSLIAGSTHRYVPVGLAMSRWQLDAQRRLCPDLFGVPA